MITTIRIQPQMDCGYICQKIQEAVIKYQKNNPDLSDSLIIIDIKNVSQNIEQQVDYLEHKLI
jgi:hypothetical protein